MWFIISATNIGTLKPSFDDQPLLPLATTTHAHTPSTPPHVRCNGPSMSESWCTSADHNDSTKTVDKTMMGLKLLVGFIAIVALDSMGMTVCVIVTSTGGVVFDGSQLVH